MITRLDTPPSIPRRHPVSGIARATTTRGVWTEADLPGRWLANDGGGACGCFVELAAPGRRGETGRVETAGCLSPMLRQAGWWRIETIGFGNPDLVLLGEDRRTEIARLDALGSRSFRGSIGGVPLLLRR